MSKKKQNVPGQGTPKRLEFVGNTPSPDTFYILYERYEKAYKAAQGKLRKGERMYLTKRNFAEFKDFYMAEANEVAPSNTPAATANEIITRMVEDSRYEYNSKQARYYKRGLATLGVNAELIDIREGKEDAAIGRLNAALEARAAELRSEGKTSYQIRHIIGVEFFGSPE